MCRVVFLFYGRMQISLKQLEAFVWVADLQSFRRAADRLHTTQPNISARIASLEAALAVTLMERDAGSVRLTTKGQELLDHARQVMAATEGLIEASQNAALFDGTLRLGVTELIAHTWLRSYLGQLSAALPKINVELTVDMSAQLEKGLAARTLDLALQNGPFSLQATGQLELGSYPLIWVAAPDLGMGGRAMTVQDLAAVPVLTHARDTVLYRDIAAHFATHRNLPVRLVPSSGLAACLHMAVNSMGVAALPEAMVRAEIARGELERIDYGWVPQSLQFFARFDAKRAARIVAQAAELAVAVAAAEDR